MQKLHSVFVVTGTAIGFAVSLVMLAQVIGFTSPWLALLVMFDFMGLAKIAEPIFMFRLPGTLSKIQAWEQAGNIYRRLGVHRFGEFLRNSPHRYLNAGTYLSPGAPDLRGLHRRAASAEATHFYAAVLFTPYIGYLGLSGQSSMGAFFLVVQVLFNVYPILNLRVLRSRLEEVLRRRDRGVRGSRAATPRLER